MEWLLSLVILSCCWLVAALAFDLVAGHGGMFSLGTPGLLLVGGYTYALLTLRGSPTFLAAVAACAAAAAIAWVAAFFLMRLNGDLFALATFGLYRVMRDLTLNLEDSTGGAVGLRGIPPALSIGTRTIGTLVMALFGLALSIALYRCLTCSAFGRTLRAIRDDAIACASLGESTQSIRTSVFAFHGGIIGFGGMLLVSNQGSVSPDLFPFTQALMIMAMAVVGGIGSCRGMIVGVTAVVVLQEVIRDFGATPALAGPLSRLATDLLFLVFLVFRPQGICGSQFQRPSSGNG